MTPPRRWLMPVVIVALTVTGCAGIASDPAATRASGGSAASADQEATPQDEESSHDPADQLPQASALASDFAQVTSGLKGDVAVAWAPVGTTGQVQMLGEVNDEDAWSTLKVPISVAAIRDDGGDLSSGLKPVLKRTITVSDNNGAVALWRSLGTRQESRDKVQAVLREAGDSATTVRATSFGRTIWKVEDQAQFAAQLPCLSGSGKVLEHMGQISKDQRWGLGSAGVDARFKGGWGISTHGWIARQLGVIVLADGSQVGVAIVAQPRNKAFTTATKHLTTISTWLASKVTTGGGRCPGGADEAGTTSTDPGEPSSEDDTSDESSTNSTAAEPDEAESSSEGSAAS